MRSDNNKYYLTCAAGEWLDGVGQNQVFCVFTKKGAYFTSPKEDKIYCLLPRQLYQKFFWALYPKSYQIEGNNSFGILKKKDAYTTEDFLNSFKCENLLN